MKNFGKRSKTVIGGCLTVVCLLLLVIVNGLPVLSSQKFTHITLAHWLDRQVFQPIILAPEPKASTLKFGPMLAETDRYVELYYSADFAVGATPPSYTFYEGANPLAFFERNGILKEYDVTRQEVVVESIRLNLLDGKTPIEIRRNLSHYPKDGVAIFELHNTHMVVHWQNVAESDLLTLLQNNLKRVNAHDVALISTFDRARGQ